MIQNTLFFPFVEHSISRQEITKMTRIDYDKIHP